jgi:hypothetical protein
MKLVRSLLFASVACLILTLQARAAEPGQTNPPLSYIRDAPLQRRL